MSIAAAYAENNKQYAAAFQQGDLALPPSKHVTIVSCMDARVDPAAQLGINLGEAHVIRNAGGSAKDALRSIIISQRLLGTHEIAVYKHTGCGMLIFTTDQLRKIVKDAEPENADVAKHVDHIDFLEFPQLEESVKDDIRFLQENPLVLKGTKISGWIYSTTTGKVVEVVL